MKKLVQWVVGLLVMCTLTGCGTTAVKQMYPGPALPPEQTASLTAPFTVDIQKVDGEKFRGAGFFTPVREFRLEFAPGPHQITARYSNPYEDSAPDHRPVWKTRPATLAFEAEAGRQYRLDVQLPGETDADGQVINQAQLRIVTVPQAAEAPALVSKPIEPPAQPSVTESNTVHHMKDWWENASETERESFQQWMKETQ